MQALEAFGHVFGLVKQTLALNLITRDDRERLCDAIRDRGAQLDIHYPATRGLFEDILGFYPPV